MKQLTIFNVLIKINAKKQHFIGYLLQIKLSIMDVAIPMELHLF